MKIHKYTTGFGAFLLCILLFTSCDLFKSVPQEEKVYDEVPGEIRGGKVYNPETKQDEEVTNIPTKADTIDWRTNSPADAPPIRSDKPANNGTGSVEKPDNKNNGNQTDPPNTDPTRPTGTGYTVPTTMKSTYEVVMMLPFVTSRFSPVDNSIYNKSEWALQYYGGAKIALEKLRAENINLNINVLDTEGDEQKVKREIETNPAVAAADVIIGPYRSINVRAVAEYAKSRNIPVVSPYSASSNITMDNAQLIQVRPTLQTHIDAITEHALKNHRPEDIVLIVRDKPEETARLKLFQKAQQNIVRNDSVASFREFVIDDTGNFDNINIRQYMPANRNTVFIIPTWANEVFVNSILRQIEIARASYQKITVYGMPQWMEFANTDYDYYEKLNVFVTSSYFVNKYTDLARSFRQTFYNRYGVRAEEAAYLGHDVTLYFGRQIHKGGTQFQQILPDNPATMMHTEFRFEPIFDTKNAAGSDANAVIERFENRYVHLLKFTDYQWRKTE